jgi:hypothetical protein
MDEVSLQNICTDMNAKEFEAESSCVDRKYFIPEYCIQ